MMVYETDSSHAGNYRSIKYMILIEVLDKDLKYNHLFKYQQYKEWKKYIFEKFFYPKV